MATLRQTSFQAFIKRHPVLAYYALTFAISWGGVLLVIGGPGSIPGTSEQFARLLPFAIPALLAGPSIAGILLAGFVYGRTLLVAMLMHASLAACTFILGPSATGVSFLTYSFVLAAAWWVVVAAVAVANSGKLSRGENTIESVSKHRNVTFYSSTYSLAIYSHKEDR